MDISICRRVILGIFDVIIDVLFCRCCSKRRTDMSCPGAYQRTDHLHVTDIAAFLSLSIPYFRKVGN